MRDDKQVPSSEWIESLRRRYPTERLIDETLTRKMRLRNGPPHKSQSAEEVQERINSFLRARISGPFNVSEVRSLAGGSSKEQFAFRLTWTDNGQERDERLALRMRPSASIVETHPLREYQAIQAVKDVIPVPKLYWIDPEGKELGQPALIYGFVEGITRPPSEGPYTPRQGFGPRYRALIGPQFLKYFAELGKLDWRLADMSAFDVPREGTNEAVIKAINWWERVWEEDSVEPCPLMTVVAQWLRNNAPSVDRVSLVHRDLRGGNFLFRPDDGRITAILDWELVHLGDRHEDIAYFLSPLFAERDEDGLELMGGFFPRDSFIREYERLSGLPVDPRRLSYYTVLNCWRSVVNSLATAPRIIMGKKTHQDIRVGWIMNATPVLLRTMCNAMKRSS